MLFVKLLMLHMYIRTNIKEFGMKRKRAFIEQELHNACVFLGRMQTMFVSRR